MKNVKSLTVVGGGVSGLISALILKERCNLEINVVYSSSVATIGVGEGSTEHFGEFMKFIGIKPSEMIKECDATFKLSVVFDNWKNNKENDRYIHTVFSTFSLQFGQYYPIYAKEIGEGSNHLYPKYVDKNIIQSTAIDVDNYPPTRQYHFNTSKLNEFLTKIAIKKGINIFDDEIIDVKLDQNGYIDSIIGKKTKYKTDFYIDASGFKKVLMNKLGVKWTSYNKYLRVNSAIAFPTKDEDNYNYFTLAKAMNAGWRFKVPVWGRHGNGYVYDDNFITEEDAKLEIEKELGHEVEIAKKFKFDAGVLNSVWTKNCVAMGLSGSFFEPLEATSIALTIQQSFLLMHKIQNYDDKVIKDYNYSFNAIVENIRDFIALHYLTKRNDTEFWKYNLKKEIPDSLKNNLEKWKTKLPVSEDFINSSHYILFGPRNFLLVMAGLDLFDKSAILKEYNFLSDSLKQEANNLFKNIIIDLNSEKFISHKEILTKIRMVDNN